MSEGGVGLVEREALDAARAEQTAANRAYYRRLERIAVQILAGYAGNASGAIAAATVEKLSETSIRMALALIKQLDALKIPE